MFYGHKATSKTHFRLVFLPKCLLYSSYWLTYFYLKMGMLCFK